MRGLLTSILKIGLPLLAGIGVATFADKQLLGKAPAYTEPVAPELTKNKLIWFLVTFIAGHLLIKFIGRKTRSISNSCLGSFDADSPEDNHSRHYSGCGTL